VFPLEQATYTGAELDSHLRSHPSCQFCRQHFYDAEELFIHNRRAALGAGRPGLAGSMQLRLRHFGTFPRQRQCLWALSRMLLREQCSLGGM
jgi:hypothetical protein